jgi:biotin synthase
VIQIIKDKVLSGQPITYSEAEYISHLDGKELIELFFVANQTREFYRKDTIDLCAIINAKSGACSEDCSYCAQSSKNKADIAVYSLLKKEIIFEKAKEAKDAGVKRFCIVTSGRKVNNKELKEIATMISYIREIELLPCATLGLLNRDELMSLKEHGLVRYHHNLETSERYFPEICRTHTYGEKIKTIEAAKDVGLSVCSGGIFGMGETWQDRIDMAFQIKKLNVDSIPINFLIPIKGTTMDKRGYLEPFEALKIISLYRFILPDKEIRVCGGRVQTLGEFNSWIFLAGADSILTGNYLTTTGRSYMDDLRLIRQLGLKCDK